MQEFWRKKSCFFKFLFFLNGYHGNKKNKNGDPRFLFFHCIHNFLNIHCVNFLSDFYFQFLRYGMRSYLFKYISCRRYHIQNTALPKQLRNKQSANIYVYQQKNNNRLTKTLQKKMKGMWKKRLETFSDILTWLKVWKNDCLWFISSISSS